MRKKYRTPDGRRVVAITTLNDLDRAIADGASIEFTACGGNGRGNDYDAPDCRQPGSGGWIPNRCSREVEADAFARNYYASGGNRLRAIYPLDQRRHLLSRLAFWRKAA